VFFPQSSGFPNSLGYHRTTIRKHWELSGSREMEYRKRKRKAQLKSLLCTIRLCTLFFLF